MDGITHSLLTVIVSINIYKYTINIVTTTYIELFILRTVFGIL